jgi:hypothetical protein
MKNFDVSMSVYKWAELSDCSSLCNCLKVVADEWKNNVSYICHSWVSVLYVASEMFHLRIVASNRSAIGLKYVGFSFVDT